MRIYLAAFLFISLPALSAVHHKVDTLGTSAKGQFIALEEYGYRSDKQVYFVEIRILNLWKKKFVGDIIRVEEPAHSVNFLQETRVKAKKMAENQLKQYVISG